MKPTIILSLFSLFSGATFYTIDGLMYLHKDWILSHNKLEITATQVMSKVDLAAHNELNDKIDKTNDKLDAHGKVLDDMNTKLSDISGQVKVLVLIETKGKETARGDK